ncbi:MAG: PRC-barrel domain-containing protein [Aureliella sp.]
MRLLTRTSLLCALALAAPAWAQQPATRQPGTQPPATQRDTRPSTTQRESRTEPAQPEQTERAGRQTEMAHILRTSTIEGMKVRNAQNEDLGHVKELVIDVDTGQVKYAALAFGGVLGIGDKLFAVPWKALTLKSGENDRYFVLNVDKQKLQQAKGFNQNQWPDMADPKWAAETETFYSAKRPGATPEPQRR